LSIKPTSASYGSAVVGTVVPPKSFVVSNTGQAPVNINGVTLNGTGADQFAVTSNGCTGSLVSGASCSVAVGATVTRNGTFSATLTVTGAGGESAQATLRLGGDFQPTLKMNPGVVSPGEVTVAIGEGFPPNTDVQLAFEGEPQAIATVHSDAAGAFRFDLLILRNGVRIGGRQVVALDQPTFSGVKAPLLIDLATYRPSGFEQASFASTVRSMYTRGG
jgi:secreted trypsin-like serine protease